MIDTSDAISKALRIASRQTDRNPSEAQKAAGNYAKGKLRWHGLEIAIENPKGTERSGVDRDGKRWAVRMPAAYGYVLGTDGKDGDHVDVYLGSDHESRRVFVIDQVDAGTKRFDEHKVMLSYPTRAAALADYDRAFSDGKARARIGAVSEVSVDAFKTWLHSGSTKRPFGEIRRAYASGGRVDGMPVDNSHYDALMSILDRLGRSQFADGGDVDPWDVPSVVMDDGVTTGDVMGAMPRRLMERDVRRMMTKRRADVPMSPDEEAAQIAGERWRHDVGEPRARELIGEASGIPGVYRAGLDSYADPSLANFTNLGARSALVAFRPMAAAKILGGGLGVAAGQDLGIVPFGEARAQQVAAAAADDGLTAEQRKRISELERKVQSGAFRTGADRRATEEELSRLRGISVDYIKGRQKSEQEVRLERERLNAGLDADARRKDREEFDRAVAAADRARDAELGQRKKFTDTEFGKVWDKAGIIAPGIFASGFGALSRAATGGGSNLHNYYLPATLGGLAGATSANFPVGYDAIFTPTENPERRAYEAYSRELPPTHPRKQEWQDYARGLPMANPTRAEASKELYDPVKAGERMTFGLLEGIGGGLVGADLMRMPGRALDAAAGSKGRAREAAARADERAIVAATSRAKSDAGLETALRKSAEARQSRGRADLLADDTMRALDQRQISADQRQRVALEAHRRSGGRRADPGSDAVAPTSRPEPVRGYSGSQTSTPPLETGANIAPAGGMGNTGPVTLQLPPSVERALEEYARRAPSQATVPALPPSLPSIRGSRPDDAKRYWDADAGAGGRSQADMARDFLSEYSSKTGSLKGLTQDQIAGSLAGAADPLKAKQISSRARELALSDPMNAGKGWQETWKKSVTPDRLRDILDKAGTGGKTLAVPLTAGVLASTLPDDAMAHPKRPKEAALFNESSGRYHGSDGKFVGGLPDSFKSGGAVSAIEKARQYASGGVVHAGPVVGASDGRADDVPIDVAAGAYVVPADVVAALGDGNSQAGMTKLARAFGPSTKKKAAGGSVPISISHGEFIVDPEQVARLGNGDMKRGHGVLDATVKKVRSDYVGHLKSLPRPAR